MADISLTQAVQADTHAHQGSGDRTVFGFWLYLMSDCIVFATIFATYAVLSGNVADGPSGRQIFDLPNVLIETGCLLLSSITYGMAMLALHRGRRAGVMAWLAVTFVLGLAFLGMEFNEFQHLIQQGFGPQRSGFLSAFFTLVGTHGLHVMVGLLWMAVLMIQLQQKGVTSLMATRLQCLSLFWHFLDIVWICVFTFVYLLGALS